MPELITPTADLHDAWLAAHREWGPGLHEDGFGITADDGVETPDGFATWVARIQALPVARLWWVVEGEAVLGGIALCPVDNDVTRRRPGGGRRPRGRPAAAPRDRDREPTQRHGASAHSALTVNDTADRERHWGDEAAPRHPRPAPGPRGLQHHDEPRARRPTSGPASS